jgi:hypothetical protein
MSMLVAPRVNAQEVATSFEQLRALLKPSDTIQVTHMRGRKTTGKLELLTASTLEIQLRNKGFPPLRFSEADVKEIRLERHDSLLNGTLIGLAAGAAPGISFIALRSKGSDPIQDANTVIGITVVPAAIGAGVGALIDWLIFKRTTVYRTPTQRSSPLQVNPLLLKSAAGVQMSVQF